LGPTGPSGAGAAEVLKRPFEVLGVGRSGLEFAADYMKKKNRISNEHSQIVVNMEAPEECRIALLEKGRLEAFQVETRTHTHTRGNLYKGVLVNVESSLQAAFVDIGLGRNAYLPLDEIHPEYFGCESEKDRTPEILKRGQELLVQITKEETPIKGSAVTTYLSIPGRYLVLMPGTEQAGVSRKIDDEAERNRIKEILKECNRPEGVGLIARTASIGVPKAEMKKDLAYLLRLWQDLRKKAGSAPAPALIYRDRDMVIRFLRDHLTGDVSEILVDDQAVYDKIRAFLRIIAPRQVATVRLHKGEDPIFSLFDLETQIDQIYQPRVVLPSGGHVVIEPTEALVSIDVNSGRNIKERDLEETALKTDLEAAGEIARQLRLRDLGGIIVIDFIDMRARSHRQELEKHMKECLKRDRARTDVSRISRFGLMEIVRQKISSPLQRGSYRPCSCCQGRGVVRSVETLALMHLRRIRAHLAGQREEHPGGMTLVVPQEVASYILNRKRRDLCAMEKGFSVEIRVEADSHLGVEDHELHVRGSQ